MIDGEPIIGRRIVSITEYGLNNTLLEIDKLLGSGNVKSLSTHVSFCINKLVFDCTGGDGDPYGGEGGSK